MLQCFQTLWGAMFAFSSLRCAVKINYLWCCSFLNFGTSNLPEMFLYCKNKELKTSVDWPRFLPCDMFSFEEYDGFSLCLELVREVNNCLLANKYGNLSFSL